jgi:hypothetical protein
MIAVMDPRVSRRREVGEGHSPVVAVLVPVVKSLVPGHQRACHRLRRRSWGAILGSLRGRPHA